MIINIYYRKNLKLTPQKLAAACSHVSAALIHQWCENGEYYYPEDTVIRVLMASDKKFNEIKEDKQSCEETITHLHIDRGLTEVEPDTGICFGWIE